jgi:hypothetical protein
MNSILAIAAAIAFHGYKWKGATGREEHTTMTLALSGIQHQL